MTLSTTVPAPLIVECRLCGLRIELNEDTETNRDQRRDPHQQIRSHLARHSATEVAQIGYRAGWLLDMLAFRCSEPERWRNNAIAMLDALVKGNI